MNLGIGHRYTWIVGLVSLSVVAGCMTGRDRMAPQEIKKHGSRLFDATVDRAAQAAVAALEAMGYAIATVVPEKGVIKTKPKMLRMDSTPNMMGYSAVAITKRYDVVITAEGAARSRITATPRLFTGEEEASDGDRVWDLYDEQSAWSRLFREIGENIATGPAPTKTKTSSH